MKKILYSTLLSLSLMGCASKETKTVTCQTSEPQTASIVESSNPFLVGAYADYRELTEEELDLFNRTYTGEVELTPKSVATQVVSGINYSFICTDSLGNKTKVIIYKPLRGEATVSLIEPATNEGESTGDDDRK